MYRIIGADGREYGPISAEQLRQWIAEGRANSETKVLLEGTTDWKRLAEFPEFGLGGAAVPPISPIVPFAPAEVKSLVDPPAIAMMITAALGILLQIANILLKATFSAYAARQAQTPGFNLVSSAAAIAFSLLGIAGAVFIFYGGAKMRKLENHGLCMAASIWAMVPCLGPCGPCCILALPAGIWSLVILLKPEVKNAFH
jgi:GYF domain 2